MSIEIKAPMPGIITKVNVTEDGAVVEGQSLIVLEAMKMENPIVATISGRVKKIEVEVSEKVATNQLLLVVE